MNTKKAIWISYDLGIKGDYTGLYAWLDNNNATECGNNVAFIRYDFGDISNLSNKDLIKILSNDLKDSVNFSNTDRIYLIWKDSETKIKGSFIIGNRKQSPWEGYGKVKGEVTEDTE